MYMLSPCLRQRLAPFAMAAALLLELHGTLTRELAALANRHFEGLASASRAFPGLSSTHRRRLRELDVTCNFLRHVTSPLTATFAKDIIAAASSPTTSPTATTRTATSSDTATTTSTSPRPLSRVSSPTTSPCPATTADPVPKADPRDDEVKTIIGTLNHMTNKLSLMNNNSENHFQDHFQAMHKMHKVMQDISTVTPSCPPTTTSPTATARTATSPGMTTSASTSPRPLCRVRSTTTSPSSASSSAPSSATSSVSSSAAGSAPSFASSPAPTDPKAIRNMVDCLSNEVSSTSEQRKNHVNALLRATLNSADPLQGTLDRTSLTQRR